MRFTLSRLLVVGRLLAAGWLSATSFSAATIGAGLLIVHGNVAQGETDLDRAQTDPDFRLQGEYQGSLTLDGRRDLPGVQVVAQGDRQFEAVLFVGGLPGAGWKPTEDRMRATGKTDDGRTEFHSDRWNAVLSDGKLTLTAPDRSPIGTLVRIDRQSPTLGQAPPSGAVVLFDGTSAEAWIAGRLAADHSLAAGTVTKAALHDFFLHLEFCLPFSPRARGQQRGNSGVYLQNRYELQVLDSFGLDGQSNECGAIYSSRAPDVNMCYPPLQWQTYDIDFTAARFDAERNKIHSARLTVKHNGVVIHDDVEIAKPTPTGLVKEYPGTGPIQLQWHLAAVTYRNIWYVEKKSLPEE